ncbi:MAG: D-glycerate dehydrogenase, partial [Alphaproteobacteria bacterium]|nr:D-glycerate dehydrogenase [Alphaproteobacteria bacterium]
ISLLTDRIDDDLLAAAGPQLKIVANVAVGFNNVDVAAATRRRVLITNTPGVLDDATATLTMALLLATARRLAEADAYIRAGKWKGWTPDFFMGLDVDGKTLGIVGAGRIGRNTARKARAFGMRILYCGRRRDEAFEAETGAQHRDRDALLAEADYVSLHLPLNEETRHFIGARELSLMKPTAVLINAARGPVVDERALVEALRSRTIWGAGLDVFEHEPELAPGLAELPNVVLAPHIGSATPATREAMARMAARNVIEALNGRPPLSPVNPEVLG